MFDGVGRRQDQTTGQLVDIGQHSLNGYERNCLFRNDGDGTFSDTAYVNDADRVEDGRGISVFDYDQDGAVDILLRNYAQPAQLLRNAGGPEHWLEVKLVGTKSNRDAIGARLTLRASGRQQVREVHAGSSYLSASSLVQHFGLGAAQTVDRLEVRWPSGARTRLHDLPADRQLVLVEGEAAPVRVDSWRLTGENPSGAARPPPAHPAGPHRADAPGRPGSKAPSRSEETEWGRPVICSSTPAATREGPMARRRASWPPRAAATPGQTLGAPPAPESDPRRIEAGPPVSGPEPADRGRTSRSRNPSPRGEAGPSGLGTRATDRGRALRSRDPGGGSRPSLPRSALRIPGALTLIFVRG